MSIPIGTKVTINFHEVQKRFEDPYNFGWYMAMLGRSHEDLLGGGYHVVIGTEVITNVPRNETYTVYKLGEHKPMFRENELELWVDRDMWGNPRG